jgi:hypothetical protein
LPAFAGFPSLQTDNQSEIINGWFHESKSRKRLPEKRFRNMSFLWTNFSILFSINIFFPISNLFTVHSQNWFGINIKQGIIVFPMATMLFPR